MAGKKKFTIEQYLTDQKIQEKIKRDEEMYRILGDPKVHEAAAAYIQNLSQLVVQVTGKKLLGCPVSEESEKVFIGKRCAQYASMQFQNWKQLEAFIGEKLPPIYQGWDVNGSMGFNGNSYLDVTDAVGSIESPLCMRLRPDGKYYVPLRTKMVMGFSKTTWKSVYQTWMEKNGYEYLLKEKKRREKENRMKEKSQLLMMETIPFEESELGRSVETIASTANNFKQVREKAKELDHLSKEIRVIGSMWNRKENIINQLIIRIPVKNNKKIIHELDEAGFDKQGRSRSSEGWDVQYKVHI